MEFTRLLFCLILLVSICSVVNSRKKNIKVKGPKEKKNKALKFFKKFGYINTFSSDIDDNELKRRVKRLQKFASLPVTGELNDETLAQLDKERCGLSDPDIGGSRKRRYLAQGTSWTKNTLSWYLNNTSPNLSRDQIRKQLTKAFQLWSDVVPLDFKEFSSSDGADIIIKFGTYHHGDPYAFDGPGGILAHAFYPFNQLGLSGDLHFDNDETFAIDDNDPAKKDLLWVAVHEIGHSLGLEHSSEKDAIMFPWYRGYNPDVTLRQDDINGIQSIYGVRKQTDKTKPTTAMSTKQPSTTQPTTTQPTTAEVTTTQPTTTQPTTTQPTTAVSTTAEPSTTQSTTPQPTTRIVTTQAPIEKTEDACPPSVNAIFKLNRFSQYTFIISGDKMWLERDGKLVRKSLSVSAYFPRLNGNIDAAYMREDGRTVFFIGREFYIYESLNYISGPVSISRLGLPYYVDHLSAAQMWVGNGMTYYYFKDRYWREDYDHIRNRIVLNGPFSLTYAWENIPEDITGTGTIGGRSLFFKDDQYYDLKISSVRAYDGYPQHIHHLFGCKPVSKPSALKEASLSVGTLKSSEGRVRRTID